jgi:hypothetical protein
VLEHLHWCLKILEAVVELLVLTLLESAEVSPGVVEGNKNVSCSLETVCDALNLF